MPVKDHSSPGLDQRRERSPTPTTNEGGVSKHSPVPGGRYKVQVWVVLFLFFLFLDDKGLEILPVSFVSIGGFVLACFCSFVVVERFVLASDFSSLQSTGHF